MHHEQKFLDGNLFCWHNVKKMFMKKDFDGNLFKHFLKKTLHEVL
jgi:hypothetical protein